jgi:TFIIF-interacting CTD phosphatase-like protein
MNSSSLNYSPDFIVKLKKMYNNIRKLYVLHMYRAFLAIDKYSRRQSNKIQKKNHTINSLIKTLQKTAISTICRVLKRNLRK